MTDITGTSGADILTGGPGDDLIKGKGGADQIFGGAGDDRLKGGGGADEISDGAGSDRMWGGNGDDIFRLAADGERDFIRDWETNDRIDLREWGVTDIADLTFQSLANGQVRVIFGDEELQIKAKGGAALTGASFEANDFIFAAPAAPAVIDFEDLSVAGPGFAAPISFIDPNYANLDWSQGFRFVEEPEAQAAGFDTGAENRTGGGDVYAIGSGLEDSFAAADNFDFESVTVGAVNRDGMTLRIVGVDDGTFVGQQFVTLSTGGSTTLALDDTVFDSVDQVVFIGYGGTDDPDYVPVTGTQSHSAFYIDDMVLA